MSKSVFIQGRAGVPPTQQPNQPHYDHTQLSAKLSNVITGLRETGQARHLSYFVGSPHRSQASRGWVICRKFIS